MLNITKKLNKDAKIKIGIFCAYVIISIYLTVTHQPWRDEAQAWLLARDAGGIGGIFSMMGYEGSPALWHLILYPFASLGFPFQTEFVIHFLLNLFAIWLLVFKSPFKPLTIVLIAFSYYPLIEYNVIARSYVLTFLALELLSVFYIMPDSKKRFVGLFSGFFILAWSNTLGTVVAGILLAIYLAKNWKNFSKRKLLGIALPAIIIFVTVGLQMLPPSDLGSHSETSLAVDTKSFARFFQSFDNAFAGNLFGLLSPDSMTDNVKYIVYPLLFIVFAIASGMSLIKKPKYLFLFAFTTLSLLALFHIKSIGASAFRHCGIIYLIFIFTHWIADKETETNWKFIPKIKPIFISISLYIILGTSLAISAVNVYRLNDHPHSYATNVFEFLNNNGYTDNSYLVGGFESAMLQVIIANMPSDFKMYAADVDEYYTYVTWDKKYRQELSTESSKHIENFLAELERSSKDKGILILDRYSNDDNLCLSYGFRKIYSIYGSFVRDEDFDVWLIER